ncbi:hypothetical protein [Streptomyces sp. NBC_01304]|nr:hypothetical protein OG430_41560 [Streptomyces sp. NBC_01304]
MRLTDAQAFYRCDNCGDTAEDEITGTGEQIVFNDEIDCDNCQENAR